MDCAKVREISKPVEVEPEFPRRSTSAGEVLVENS